MRNGREQSLRATVEELDLDSERGTQAPNKDRQAPEEQGQDSFGLTLSNVSPQTARRLQMPSGLSGALVTEVDPDGPSAGALRQGDVILSVNDQKISSASDAGQTAEGPRRRIARLRIRRATARSSSPSRE
jgi:serine protease Do